MDDCLPLASSTLLHPRKREARRINHKRVTASKTAEGEKKNFVSDGILFQSNDEATIEQCVGGSVLKMHPRSAHMDILVLYR